MEIDYQQRAAVLLTRITMLYKELETTKEENIFLKNTLNKAREKITFLEIENNNLIRDISP